MFFKHSLDSVASIQALLMPTNNKIKFNLNEMWHCYEVHLARGNQMNIFKRKIKELIREYRETNPCV